MQDRIRFFCLLLIALVAISPAAKATTYYVSNTYDSGAGSLREAITRANDHAGYDLIAFNIPTTDPGYFLDVSGVAVLRYWRIIPASPLPAITETVLIDGTSQPYTSPLYDNPVILIDGQNAGSGAYGLFITRSLITVRKIAVINFDQAGIKIDGEFAQNNVVDDCWSGVLPANPLVAAPNLYGIWIESASNTVQGSLVSGNSSDGILIEGIYALDNLVKDSRVGITPGAVATSAIPNGGNGVHIDGADENQIGIADSDGSNHISGNALAGILVTGDRNEIDRAWVGTDAPNGTAGVVLGGSQNLLGYSNGVYGWGNTIAGNTTNGVEVGGTFNVVVNSVIGLGVNGTIAHPNGGHGVLVYGSSEDAAVGSNLYSAAVNVISGNALSGVYVEYDATRPDIRGNYIGVGMPLEDNIAIGNGEHGIHLHGIPPSGGRAATNATIGGGFSGHNNVISGNLEKGIYTTGSDNTIQGNHIGVNEDGDVAIPNGSHGIYLDAPDNMIEENVISGNTSTGIFCLSCSGSILGNKIGTDATGASPIGNGHNGVFLGGYTTPVQIGGIVPADRNTIAFNHFAGVYVGTTHTEASIRGNSIFANGDLGVDLYPNGPNTNDDEDPDTGANNKMNHPILHVATYTDATNSVGVLYEITSQYLNAPRPIEVDFYLADEANEEGRTYIGSHTYTATGMEAKVAGFNPSPPIDHNMIVATATDADGNTSEFSPPMLLSGAEGVTADVRILLEGPFDGTDMTTDLRSGFHLPSVQPYDVAPWNYSGTEAGGLPSEMTDWVLVGLRTSISPATLVAQRAGFLLSDGSIVDLDGASPLFFPGVADGQYLVTVFHRNHLGIMSSAFVDFSTGAGSWDFTLALNKAYGSPDATIDLGGGSGPYGMFAGDANADGDVQALDFNDYIAATTSGSSGYEAADFNMDVNVQALDFNLYIANTVAGASSQVP